MSHETPSQEHHWVRLAAELSAASLGVGAASYLLWRRQHQQGESAETRRFKSQAAILQEPELSLRYHRLLNQAAARIYLATIEREGGIITRGTLMRDMGVSRPSLNHTTGYLTDKKAKLVDRRVNPENPKSEGYFATEALIWAAEEGDFPELRAVIDELRPPEPSDNS